ncbi:MAG: hypothetical protein RIC55_09685 [Pirellulaceae bacterium]
MRQAFRLVTIAGLFLLLSTFSGCNPVGDAMNQAQQAAGSASMQADLGKLAEMYHMHHDANGQGPAGWDELIAFTEKMNKPTEPIARVREAGYNVKWGVKFSTLTEGMTNTVMAEKAGGPTLMFDGAVR